MNLEKSSTTPSKILPKWPAVVFALASFAGFLDASYLAAKFYLGGPIPCSILNGCEKVTTSEYATIFGVSIALFGAIYYLSILILTIAHLDTKKMSLLYIASLFTFIGFLFSLRFLYLQLFVIHALCLYCLFSLFTSSLLFITGLVVLKYRHDINRNTGA